MLLRLLSVPESDELSVLVLLVKTISVELLVEETEPLETEPLDVSIIEKLLVDEEFFESSETFENSTMKTPAQSPRSTIIISM